MSRTAICDKVGDLLPTELADNNRCRSPYMEDRMVMIVTTLVDPIYFFIQRVTSMKSSLCESDRLDVDSDSTRRRIFAVRPSR
jgi:hypothetical protein